MAAHTCAAIILIYHLKETNATLQLTATHINYYFICHRKLWLFGNGITMEHTSNAVADGRFTGKSTYPQRAERYTEIEVGGSKIDFYDAQSKVVHEIKRSDKMEDAHLWQVRFYIWLLKQAGVEGASGRVEYPKLRQITPVVFSASDETRLRSVMADAEAIIAQIQCPPVINSKICKNCAYCDFCYISE